MHRTHGYKQKEKGYSLVWPFVANYGGSQNFSTHWIGEQQMENYFGCVASIFMIPRCTCLKQRW